MTTMRKLGVTYIVSGPSGVGKSTVLTGVRARHPELDFSVSCTTRAPRAGETDHVHYHFITPEDFELRVGRGEFLEYAGVFAKRYGTLKSEVLDRVRAGRSVLLDIDVQGAMQIKEALRHDEELRRVCRLIFIAPPSFAELERRLRARATDSEEQIELRLAQVRRELGCWSQYDFAIVNDALDDAVNSFVTVVEALQLSTSLWPEERFDA